jgi:hypothetical protein
MLSPSRALTEPLTDRPGSRRSLAHPLLAAAIVLGLAFAPQALAGTYQWQATLSKGAPEQPFHWTPPTEGGEVSGATGSPYDAFSIFVTESGVYTLTSEPFGETAEELWPGLMALYSPPFDPAAPLRDLIAVDYALEEFAPLAEPVARIDAYLVAGVVYRVVTSNAEEAFSIRDYRNRITGPGEIRRSACYPVGDEVTFNDTDTDGFALQRDTFCALVDWEKPNGMSGAGHAVPHRTDASALFWFFAPHNWELQVKVLDACALNGHYWVFFSATTNVAFDLHVFGRGSNFANPELTRIYHNDQGHPADAVTDTAAFPCDEVIPEL